MGYRRLQKVEEYATKYTRFKHQNKNILNLMSHYKSDELELNQHDFQQIVKVYRELNSMHVQLLQFLAKNAKDSDDE